jgi:hypothetical protein
MTEGAARSVAVQSLTLLPEFPHLALAHVSLALMQDDPCLKNGDLAGFLRWALAVPGSRGSWGSCGEWLEYLCPKRFPEGCPSRDWRAVRKRFAEADALIKSVAAEVNVPKRISVFLDASTWGLRGAASKRKMKAALALGNELLSLLDEEGFDVHFHYEAENDGKIAEPAIPAGTHVYLGLRTVVAMGRTAELTTPRYEDQPIPMPLCILNDTLLETLRDGGFQILDESVVTVPREEFPNTEIPSLVVNFPITPRAGEAEIEAWAGEFATILTRGLIAADEGIRQTVS